ncbi:uncharacterized protein J3D65DRAFT_132549 [Phyllosticta citribraziliensis]|uniref:Uncharacterized protein n=1 Tax=Phyllosticta citribraziliensis TaxID=989973 RepID=A0ABR1L622_9PEZI
MNASLAQLWGEEVVSESGGGARTEAKRNKAADQSRRAPFCVSSKSNYCQASHVRAQPHLIRTSLFPCHHGSTQSMHQSINQSISSQSIIIQSIRFRPASHRIAASPAPNSQCVRLLLLFLAQNQRRNRSRFCCLLQMSSWICLVCLRDPAQPCHALPAVTSELRCGPSLLAAVADQCVAHSLPLDVSAVFDANCSAAPGSMRIKVSSKQRGQSISFRRPIHDTHTLVDTSQAPCPTRVAERSNLRPPRHPSSCRCCICFCHEVCCCCKTRDQILLF